MNRNFSFAALIHTSRLLLSFVITCISGNLASAQNLISNGGFETGAFGAWVPAGSVSISAPPFTSVGAHACLMQGSGSIAQTVTTTPGAVYYVGADVLRVQNPVVEIRAGAVGGAVDGARTLPITSNDTRFSLVFTASSASTEIRITNSDDQAAAVTDEVQLIELPPSTLAGKYNGTIRTAFTGAPRPLGSATVKVVGEISATGQLTMVDAQGKISGGIFLPDGTLDIRIDGVRHLLTPEGRGSKITLTWETEAEGLDEGQNAITVATVTTIKLTRVSR